MQELMMDLKIPWRLFRSPDNGRMKNMENEGIVKVFATIGNSALLKAIATGSVVVMA